MAIKVVMLADGEQLLEGEIIKTLKSYTHTDYKGNTTGYKILAVAGNVVKEIDGKRYIPLNTADNAVIVWELLD